MLRDVKRRMLYVTALGLAGAAVFDAPPTRAAYPFVVVGEPVVTMAPLRMTNSESL